jgi:hypothetical protein
VSNARRAKEKVSGALAAAPARGPGGRMGRAGETEAGGAPGWQPRGEAGQAARHARARGRARPPARALVPGVAGGDGDRADLRQSRGSRAGSPGAEDRGRARCPGGGCGQESARAGTQAAQSFPLGFPGGVRAGGGRPGASTHRPRGGGRGMETGDKDEEEGKVLPEVWRGACDRGEEEKEGDTCRHAGDSHPRLSPAATPPTPRAPTDENTRIERGKTKCTFIKLKTWTPRGAGDGPSGPPGGAGEPYTGSWGCWVGSGTPGAGGPSPWVWDADRLFGGSS